MKLLECLKTIPEQHKKRGIYHAFQYVLKFILFGFIPTLENKFVFQLRESCRKLMGISGHVKGSNGLAAVLANVFAQDLKINLAEHLL